MPKKLEENIDVGEILHEWTVQEYEKHERNRAWYVIMSIIGIVLLAYSLLTSNFLFSLVLILFVVIIFLQAHQDPIVIPFGITDLGILLNDRFYPYGELKSFFVIYNPEEGVKTLYIDQSANLSPRLRVPLLDMDPNEIRITLMSFLEEESDKEEEPLSDMIGRKWRLF